MGQPQADCPYRPQNLLATPRLGEIPQHRRDRDPANFV
jgi:hypothetical protein